MRRRGERLRRWSVSFRDRWLGRWVCEVLRSHCVRLVRWERKAQRYLDRFGVPCRGLWWMRNGDTCTAQVALGLKMVFDGDSRTISTMSGSPRVGLLNAALAPSQVTILHPRFNYNHKDNTLQILFSFIMPVSENKARALRGELYHAFTPELVAERRRCARACSRYNKAEEVTRRQQVELWKA